MHLKGQSPCLRVIPDNNNSVAITLTEGAGLSISFANPPTSNVTVTLLIDNETAAAIEPKELVFTPDNYAVPQKVTMMGLEGELKSEDFTVTASTASDDPVFDGVNDRWTYTVNR